MLEISEIFNAAAVLKDVARRTAIIPAPKLCPGLDLYLKTENLQLQSFLFFKALPVKNSVVKMQRV